MEEEFTDLVYGSTHQESSDGIATIRGIAVKNTNETNDDTLKWYSEELKKFQTHVDVWKKDYKVFSENTSEYEANKIRSHCKDYWNRILRKKELHSNISNQLMSLAPEENLTPLLSLMEKNALFERYSRFTRWVILFDATMNVDIKNELLYQPKK